MDKDDFANDVHQRLIERRDSEAALDPHGTLMEIARQERLRHPLHYLLSRMSEHRTTKPGRFERLLQNTEPKRVNSDKWYAAAIILLLIVGCIGWGLKLAEFLSCAP